MHLSKSEWLLKKNVRWFETPQVELLGVKDLIEGGAFKSSQYVDLVSQAYPPQAEPGEIPSRAESDTDMIQEQPVSGQSSNSVAPAEPSSADISVDPLPVDSHASEEVDKSPMDDDIPKDGVSGDSDSTYGPIRRRVKGKDGPNALFRPPSMRQEDFVEVMREVIPQMIDALPQGTKELWSQQLPPKKILRVRLVLPLNLAPVDLG